VFEVIAPDGRVIRHQGETSDEVAARLTRGYEVYAEVFGAGADLKGGYSVRLGGPSLMAIILERHGDELMVWLRSNGFVKR
jgi:hypothetical protein